MKPTTLTLSKLFAIAAPLAAVFVCSGEARAQVEVYPPAGYIATVDPVYYEGHAAYWYGNHWQWRDGGGWHAYRDEPAFLRDRRGRGIAVHHYEHFRGRR